jgi:hypothetical protein
MDVRHDAREIDGHGTSGNTEAMGVARIGRGAGASEERFAGNAASPQAFAAHTLVLDQCDACTQASGARGRDKAGGTATNGN